MTIKYLLAMIGVPLLNYLMIKGIYAYYKAWQSRNWHKVPCVTFESERKLEENTDSYVKSWQTYYYYRYQVGQQIYESNLYIVKEIYL